MGSTGPNDGGRGRGLPPPLMSLSWPPPPLGRAAPRGAAVAVALGSTVVRDSCVSAHIGLGFQMEVITELNLMFIGTAKSQCYILPASC